MKTLSQYPGLIGRLVEAYEQRQQVRALPRLKRLAWHVQVFCDGVVRWLLWPFVKFALVPFIIGIAIAATLVSLFTR